MNASIVVAHHPVADLISTEHWDVLLQKVSQQLCGRRFVWELRAMGDAFYFAPKPDGAFVSVESLDRSWCGELTKDAFGVVATYITLMFLIEQILALAPHFEGAQHVRSVAFGLANKLITALERLNYELFCVAPAHPEAESMGDAFFGKEMAEELPDVLDILEKMRASS